MNIHLFDIFICLLVYLLAYLSICNLFLIHFFCIFSFTKEDGSKRTRIRFNIEGPRGHFLIWVEVSQIYLIYFCSFPFFPSSQNLCLSLLFLCLLIYFLYSLFFFPFLFLLLYSYSYSFPFSYIPFLPFTFSFFLFSLFYSFFFFLFLLFSFFCSLLFLFIFFILFYLFLTFFFIFSEGI